MKPGLKLKQFKQNITALSVPVGGRVWMRLSFDYFGLHNFLTLNIYLDFLNQWIWWSEGAGGQSYILSPKKDSVPADKEWQK